MPPLCCMSSCVSNESLASNGAPPSMLTLEKLGEVSFSWLKYRSMSLCLKSLDIRMPIVVPAPVYVL